MLVPCLNLSSQLLLNSLIWWKKSNIQILKKKSQIKISKKCALVQYLRTPGVYNLMRRTCNWKIFWLLSCHFLFLSLLLITLLHLSVYVDLNSLAIYWDQLTTGRNESDAELDRGGLLITSRCFVPLHLSNHTQ